MESYFNRTKFKENCHDVLNYYKEIQEGMKRYHPTVMLRPGIYDSIRLIEYCLNPRINFWQSARIEFDRIAGRSYVIYKNPDTIPEAIDLLKQSIPCLQTRIREDVKMLPSNCRNTNVDILHEKIGMFHQQLSQFVEKYQQLKNEAEENYKRAEKEKQRYQEEQREKERQERERLEKERLEKERRYREERREKERRYQEMLLHKQKKEALLRKLEQRARFNTIVSKMTKKDFDSLTDEEYQLYRELCCDYNRGSL